MQRLHLIVSFLLISMLGCAKTDLPTATDSAADDAVQQLPEPGAPTVSHQHPRESLGTLQPDAAYPVPELNPHELLRYIQQLASQKPRGTTQQEFVQDQIRRAKSQLIAAERIVQGSRVEPSLLEAATKAKLDTLRLLAILDHDGLGQHYRPLVDSLLVSEVARHRLLANVSQLEYEMDRLGIGEEQQPEKLVAQLQQILVTEGAGRAEFFIAQYAGITLDQQGFPQEATRVLNLVAEHFAGSDDQQLAAEAKLLRRQTVFRQQVMDASTGGQPEFQQLMSGIQSLLRDPADLTQEHLDLTLNAGQMLEYRGKLNEAQGVYRAVRTAFAQADAPLTQQVERSFDYAQKRLGVIGKPVDIKGIHTDGTPFDWDRLRGKVVLVDFWATWSGPWHHSLPELEATYDRFHDEGFEVVGVNLDESTDTVYQFLRERRLRWTTVIDESAGGFGNPNAVRYGIEAVPFAMLVGKDGKVVRIHLHGSELREQLESLLQPVGKTAATPQILK